MCIFVVKIFIWKENAEYSRPNTRRRKDEDQKAGVNGAQTHISSEVGLL